MNRQKPVQLDLGRLPPLEPEPVPALELGFDGPDAVRPLGMEARVVLERGRVAEVER
jgi:hypothetical protein